MRIGVLTCLWKRHELAAEMLRHTTCIAVDLEREGIELVLLAVGSEGEASRAIAEYMGWSYLEAPNEPLSDKFNAGAERFRVSLDDPIDGLVVLGSDDFVTADLFRCWAQQLRSGVALAGVLDAYILRAGDGRMLHWGGYGGRTGRAGETIGTARMLSRSLLVALSWRPWPKELKSGLDAGMMQRIAGVAIPPQVRLRMDQGPGPILDVRMESDVDMSTFDRYTDEALPMSAVEELDVLGAFRGTIATLRAIGDPVKQCKPLFENDPLSRTCATLIVRNESTRLRRCLESVAKVTSGCIVLDTGSTDRTIDVANACGARVERYAGEASGVDFSEWRNCLLWIARSAGMRRVLMIDADQVLADPTGLREALDGEAAAASVTIAAKLPNGNVETYRSIQVMDPSVVGYEFPVHNQLRGIVEWTDTPAVFETSYAGNLRAKAKRSLPVLRRFIRAKPLNPHGYFYAARHAKSLGWMRLAHRMNRRCVRLAPSAVEYATAWPDLVLTTMVLEGVEQAEAVLAEAKRYHPGLDEVRRVAVALEGVMWTEAARNPGLYAFLPRSSVQAPLAFPRVAAALDLPFIWSRQD